MNINVPMPIALTAEWEAWDSSVDGSCVSIKFGVISLAVIPTPEYDGPGIYTRPDDHDVSAIAAKWLSDLLRIDVP